MQTVSAKVPDDVAEKVEQYQNQQGISKSEAVRRLLVAGLADDDLEQRVDDLERRVRRLEQRPAWWPW